MAREVILRLSRAAGWSTDICRPSSVTFCRDPTRFPEPEVQMVEVSPAHGSQISSQVLCECHWQPLPQRRTALTAIILHGLEGSSHSQYVTGNANKLWRAGCNVVRMNMRNCGRQ
jgi:predicted alpha/beta-fold hydrolase